MSQETPRIILGSSSPWRRKVLAQADIHCEVMSPDIDEKAIRYDDPAILTQALAGAKATAIAARIISGVALVITADQVAVFKGEIREKPETPAQARAWLAEYGATGRPVSLVTTVMVSRIGGLSPRSLTQTHAIEVALRPIPKDVIDTIVERGGVMLSCGAMVVEDPGIAPYIVSVTGPGTEQDVRTSEQGLPIGPTLDLLARFGHFNPAY